MGRSAYHAGMEIEREGWRGEGVWRLINTAGVSQDIITVKHRPINQNNFMVFCVF